jgi:phage terminase large subunit
VHTFWDLGHADKTAIWFAQIIGFEYRIIDFYQNRLKGPSHYVQMLQNKGYIYGTDYLPHDADYAQFIADGRTIADIMRAAGRNVFVVKRPTKKEITFNAVRTIFPNCWFDSEKTADGLQCLRHYRFDVDPNTRAFTTKPAHDENSHAADAFGTLGLFIARDEVEKDVDVSPPLDLNPTSLSWMGR